MVTFDVENPRDALSANAGYGIRAGARGGEKKGCPVYDGPDPDLGWYLALSRARQVTPRCPFASVERCPRYYQSLSLLGQAGSTKIESDEDNRLKALWQKSDLWPRTAEGATSIWSSDEQTRGFSEFCPEVIYDRFHLFASGLHRYADEIDIDLAHERLGREGARGANWRWSWAAITPMHFTECPLYSPLTRGDGLPPEKTDAKRSVPLDGKPGELLTLKPGIWGMSVDLKEVARRIWRRFQKA